MQTRIFTDQAPHASLKKYKETLWWHTEWLPSLNSPYFPFRQSLVAAELAQYERLYDGYSFQRKPPAD
jgi:hypothetical protein